MSNVTPIRAGFTTEQLIAAVDADTAERSAQFLVYAAENGFALTDEDGRVLTSTEVAWKHIVDNRILMDEKPNLKIVS